MTDKQLQEEATAWLSMFIRDHFPEGIEERLLVSISAMLIDAFIDGVTYGQEVVATESRIIRPGKH
jgi:hypothetical protein